MPKFYVTLELPSTQSREAPAVAYVTCCLSGSGSEFLSKGSYYAYEDQIERVLQRVFKSQSAYWHSTRGITLGGREVFLYSDSNFRLREVTRQIKLSFNGSLLEEAKERFASSCKEAGWQCSIKKY